MTPSEHGQAAEALATIRAFAAERSAEFVLWLNNPRNVAVLDLLQQFHRSNGPGSVQDRLGRHIEEAL